jgi:DNA topoisomerase VI subunit A
MAYARHLQCNFVEWIGIKPSTLKPLDIWNQLIPLSMRDRKKLLKLLSRPIVCEQIPLLKEISKLLHLGYKAEIQVLNSEDLALLLSQ